MHARRISGSSSDDESSDGKGSDGGDAALSEQRAALVVTRFVRYAAHKARGADGSAAADAFLTAKATKQREQLRKKKAKKQGRRSSFTKDPSALNVRASVHEGTLLLAGAAKKRSTFRPW